MKQVKIDQAREFGERYLRELKGIMSKKRRYSKKIVGEYIEKGREGLEKTLSYLESDRFDDLTEEEVNDKVAEAIRRNAGYFAIEKKMRHHLVFPRESEEQFRDRLSEENRSLVMDIANKMSNSTGVDREELVGHGMIGLCKAIDNYDPNRNIQFSTFAHKCIQNEMLGMMRKENQVAKNNVSLGAVVSRDKDGKEMELGASAGLGKESEAVPEKIEAKKDFNQSLRELMDSELTALEKHIAVYRFELYGAKIKTQVDLAEELRISQASISKMEKDVKIKLRNLVVDHAHELGLEESTKYKQLVKRLFEDGWFDDDEESGFDEFRESEDLMDQAEFVSIDELDNY